MNTYLARSIQQARVHITHNYTGTQQQVPTTYMMRNDKLQAAMAALWTLKCVQEHHYLQAPGLHGG